MQRADYIRHGVISIHALLAESDACASSASGADPSFLSTLSLRRATGSVGRSSFKLTYFYPRSPCGERPHANRYYVGLHLISIHALLAESDSLTTYFETSSMISIHALLAESDCTF